MIGGVLWGEMIGELRWLGVIDELVCLAVAWSDLGDYLKGIVCGVN